MKKELGTIREQSIKKQQHSPSQVLNHSAYEMTQTLQNSCLDA